MKGSPSASWQKARIPLQYLKGLFIFYHVEESYNKRGSYLKYIRYKTLIQQSELRPYKNSHFALLFFSKIIKCIGIDTICN